MAGPMIDAAIFTYEAATSEPLESCLNLEEPVWLLGKYFRPDQEMKKIKQDVLSRFWFTYRKNFAPIGGTGPVSDTGWGCMLRCGQMMLAQALLCKHLGRDWKWRHGGKDPLYMAILWNFLDKKDSLYSIHQIAQMGVGEGKLIGQWFGPNTVAQVLRKLVLFDNWSDLAVHVAMDNTVVVEDIKMLCQTPKSHWDCYESSNPHRHNATSPAAGKCSCCTPESHEHLHANQRPTHRLRSKSSKHSHINNESSCFHSSARSHGSSSTWRPLVLFIPLRLGLSDVNRSYFASLKVMFTLKQSLGMIGGKPNHAYYFIGFNGDRLLYLDPHKTQATVRSARHNAIPDESFHCLYPSVMNFGCLDPSIALGVYCHTEADFDDWCSAVKELVMDREKRPMFEICKKRPSHWPPFELPQRPCQNLDSAKTGFTELNCDYKHEEQVFDSSGEFEIL